MKKKQIVAAIFHRLPVVVAACCLLATSYANAAPLEQSTKTTRQDVIGNTVSKNKPQWTILRPRAFIFSPYKDTGIGLDWNTNVLGTHVATGRWIPLLGARSLYSTHLPTLPAITLGFAVGECGNETWSTIPGQALMKANLTALKNSGLPYVIATGGAGGLFTCSSTANFDRFIARYRTSNLIGVDFDIEANQSQQDIDNLVAIAEYGQGKYPTLRFSFTIATIGASDGSKASVNTLGDTVIRTIQASNLRNYTINLMTMNYGSVSHYVCVVEGDHCDMGKTAIQAVKNVSSQYGIPLNKIEITPEIGLNEVAGEIFTLQDVEEVTQFVRANGLAGLHFWSQDRDTPCNDAEASPVCNSIPSSINLGYTRRFLYELTK